MYKLLTFLVVSMVCSTVVFAQTNTDAITARKIAYWKKVDTTTEWGKWLLNELKPYWERIDEVTAKAASSMMKITPSSHDDLFKKSQAVHLEGYKAMQNITPPEDFKAFHALLLKEWAKLSQTTNQQQVLQLENDANQISNEQGKELEKVLKRHSVPQNMIGEFTEVFWK